MGARESLLPSRCHTVHQSVLISLTSWVLPVPEPGLYTSPLLLLLLLLLLPLVPL